LQKLCLEIPNRCVGSPGNRMATDFFAGVVSEYGFQIEMPEFDCLDWSHGESWLKVGDETFETMISPYSLPCQVSARLAAVSSVEELEASEITGQVVLLMGDITQEQLMPKNFTFYNPEHHKHIIQLLETKAPAAIVAATSRNPELAGGVYPFPLIEDGDFDIPSVYIKDTAGEALVKYAGEQVSLKIDAQRIPAKGVNVIARKGERPDRRVVVCAHIDSKEGTPGALDNGTGIVVLLLLAELLRDYSGNLCVEILALNGEDYYSAPGQVHYLKANEGKLDEITLAINLDLAGYYEGKTAFSLYGCPPEIVEATKHVISSQDEFIEGEQWYQSDHSIFIQNGRPAIAITSDTFMQLSTDITHTDKDRPELVDLNKLVTIAQVLAEFIRNLDI